MPLRDRFDQLQRRSNAVSVALSTVRKGGKDGAGRLAAVVSYYSFFSLFPLLLVLVAVLGYLVHGSMREKILDSALANFPGIGTSLTSDTGELTGSGLALAIGLVTAIWAGTGAFDAFSQAMHVVWDGVASKQEAMWRRRLRALLQMLVLGGALVLTTAASTLLGRIVSMPGVARIASLLITAALNGLFALALYVAAVGERHRWRRHIPGAVSAGIGLTVLHLAGAWYLTRLVARASDTYGTFATVIGLLSWLNLLASLLIWSAELSSVIDLRTSRSAAVRHAGRRARMRPQRVN